MSIRIGVIGLGYVGLPLAVEFGKLYPVIGFDINHERIEELRTFKDSTLEVTSEELKNSKNLKFATTIEQLQDCNYFIVAVPTPVDENHMPDLTPLVSSSTLVGKILKKDDIVIYESTVYPGVTEEICVPILEQKSNLKYNKDFYCGYSPERINPGDKERKVYNILKITSGSTPEVAQKVDQLYKKIITAGTFLASNIKVAEAAKVIENTQRDVNIALVNELSIIFDKMGIDTHNVIEAASTKWNFIKLTPGLVGGHCIGVDPYYLAFKAEAMDYRPNIILAARQINEGMSKFIVEKTIKLMINADKKIKGSNILVLGITFKENCPDLRNTKVIDIVNSLKHEYGCNVDIYDPVVSAHEMDKEFNLSTIQDPFQNKNKKYDACILAVAHQQFASKNKNDFLSILEKSHVVVDVKGVLDYYTWRL